MNVICSKCGGQCDKSLKLVQPPIHVWKCKACGYSVEYSERKPKVTTVNTDFLIANWGYEEA